MSNPESQAERAPITFGMRGENMRFHIGAQSFTLDYKPDGNESFKFMADMLTKAISRAALPPVAAVPDGYALVPVEPTEAMAVAGSCSIIDGQENRPGTSWAEEATMAYEAMLAAAPTQGE